MIANRYFPRRVLPVLPVLLATVMTAGCGALQTLDETPPPDPEHIVIRPAAKVEDVAPYVDRFALMALFALTVYREDIDKQQLSPAPCGYLGNEAHRYVRLDMPGDAGGSWKRWTAPGACFNQRGLYYETYVYEARDPQGSPRLTEAVISIRGTELRDWHDMKANASGIVDFDETEYTIARDRIAALIKALVLNGIESIYLTGHSLGGGIAQHIAFISKDVKETFAFNPSPVTNWMRLCKTTADLNWDPKINRIYQGKEVLAYVRNVTTRFNSELYWRNDFRFGFVEANAVVSHSMNNLACQLAARVCPYGADHHYSHDSAQATLKDKILCPDSVVEKLPTAVSACTVNENAMQDLRRTWREPKNSAPAPGSCRP
jgi:pimeloyl-ACP methyl ester carboxylesterase